MFSAGFIQKTVEEDLFVKENYGILPRKQREKILEDEADPRGCHVRRNCLERPEASVQTSGRSHIYAYIFKLVCTEF